MMKWKGYMVVLFWSISMICYAQMEHYEIDPKRSTIAFSVTHMGLLTVEGHFTHFTGAITFDANKELEAIQSKIHANSIDTRDASRDQTLRSDAYLQTTTYPHISFSATEITSHTITGILQIKEVKNEIQMPYTYLDTKNTDEIRIKMSATIRRSDFKLDFGAMDLLVGDTISIVLEIYTK
jgi:polyisoprenoid-binding protein YceI